MFMCIIIVKKMFGFVNLLCIILFIHALAKNLMKFTALVNHCPHSFKLNDCCDAIKMDY